MNLRTSLFRRHLIFLPAIAAIFLFTSIATAARIATSRSPFEDLPFNVWLDGKNVSQIPWTVSVKSHGLSGYQRLGATITVFAFLGKKEISGGEGTLLAVVRITDAQGRVYESNRSSDLKRPTDDQIPELALVFPAYLLPGDYKVDTAIYSTASHKHSVSHQMLHMLAIPSDPLPSAWADLPEVEFYPPLRAPLGLVDDRLQLSLQTNHNVRLDVLANVSPTNAYRPSTFIYRRSSAALFQELDVLSQITPMNGTLNIAGLDLANQKVQFEKDDVGTISERSLWRALMAHNSNVVSAVSLSHQTDEASFFISQVKQRLSAMGAKDANLIRAIIVVSNQMAFPKGEDLTPISVPDNCNCRVFYIRNHVLLDPQTAQTMMNISPGGPTGPSTGPEGSPPPGHSPDAQKPPRLPPLNDRSTKVPDVDELEQTLAPLHPHVFDVNSPEEFRRALATILSEIGSS